MNDQLVVRRGVVVIFLGMLATSALVAQTIPDLTNILGSADIIVGTANTGFLARCSEPLNCQSQTLAEMDLPRGSYAIFARMNLSRTDLYSAFPVGPDAWKTTTVSCELAAPGGDRANDTADWKLEGIGVEGLQVGEGATDIAVGMQIATELRGPGVVRLSCVHVAFGEVEYSELKIIALKGNNVASHELRQFGVF